MFKKLKRFFKAEEIKITPENILGTWIGRDIMATIKIDKEFHFGHGTEDYTIDYEDNTFYIKRVVGSMFDTQLIDNEGKTYYTRTFKLYKRYNKYYIKGTNIGDRYYK